MGDVEVEYLGLLGCRGITMVRTDGAAKSHGGEDVAIQPVRDLRPGRVLVSLCV